MGEAFTRMVSPYAYGPFYNNPLTDILGEFDYEQVCADDGPALFINATRVRNGKLRVFAPKRSQQMSLWRPPVCRLCFQAVEMI